MRGASCVSSVRTASGNHLASSPEQLAKSASASAATSGKSSGVWPVWSKPSAATASRKLLSETGPGCLACPTRTPANRSCRELAVGRASGVEPEGAGRQYYPGRGPFLGPRTENKLKFERFENNCVDVPTSIKPLSAALEAETLAPSTCDIIPADLSASSLAASHTALHCATAVP